MRGKCSVVAAEGSALGFAQSLYNHLRAKEGDRYAQDRQRFREGINSYLGGTGLARINSSTLQGLAERIYDLSQEGNGNGFEYVQISVDNTDGVYSSRLERSIQFNQCFPIHNPRLPRNEWFKQLKSMQVAINNSRPSDTVYILPFIDWDGEACSVISGDLNLPHTGLITIDASNNEMHKYNIPKSNLCGLPVMAKNLLERGIDTNWRVLTNKDILDRSRNDLQQLGFKDLVETDNLIPGEFPSSFLGKSVLYYNTGHIGQSQVDMVRRLRGADVFKVISVNPHGLFTTNQPTGQDCAVGTQLQLTFPRTREEVASSTNPIDIIRKFDGFYIGDVTKQDDLPGLEIISLAQLVGDEVYRVFTERSSPSRSH